MSLKRLSAGVGAFVFLSLFFASSLMSYVKAAPVATASGAVYGTNINCKANIKVGSDYRVTLQQTADNPNSLAGLANDMGAGLDWLSPSNIRTRDYLKAMYSYDTLFPETQQVIDLLDDSRSLVYIYFTGADSTNEDTCRNGAFLVQSPTDKLQFFGVQDWADNGYDAIDISGAIDVATRSVYLSFGSGEQVQMSFDVISPANMFDVASYFGTTGGGGTPAPGGGGGSVGPCSGLTGYVYSSCMGPRFDNAAQITYNGDTFVADSWTGQRMYYRLTKSWSNERTQTNGAGTGNNCRPYFELNNEGGDYDINLDGDGVSQITQMAGAINTIVANGATLKYQDKDTTCNDLDSRDITVNGANMRRWATLYSTNPAEIQLVFADGGGSEKPYILSYAQDATDKTTFVAAGFTDCESTKPRITLSRDPTGVSAGSTIDATWLMPARSNCDTASVNITVVAAATDAAPPQLPEPGRGAGDTGGDTQPTCEDSVDGGFGWLVCWIIDGADRLIGWMEGIIQSQLEVDTSFFTNEELKSAWTQVARISSGLLVIVGLAMVISTALGFSMFDAYTVKKVLPKLVIAAVFIWLSWGLVTTYVTIMNDVGKGIADLLFSPFGNFSEVDLGAIVGKATASSGGGSDAVFSGLLLGGMVAAVLASGGVFAVLAALVPVIAFIAIGFVVLVFRQAIIIFLVVMAPLGIAAWILPNTEKIWKLWSGTLNKLLIMFPLFMGIFAAAKIFAWTTAGATGGAAEVVVTVLAYVSPFIFLPALFKAAGGLLSSITGIVNNKGKGVFDRAQGALQKRNDAIRAPKKAAKEARMQSWANNAANRRARTGAAVFGGVSTAVSKVPGMRNRNVPVVNTLARNSSNLATRTGLGAISSAEKDMELFKSDADVLNALARYGSLSEMRAALSRGELKQDVLDRVQTLGGQYIGDRAGRAAALKLSASQGRASAVEFESVAELYRNDVATGNIIVNGAAFAAKQAGDVTNSTIKFDAKTGELKWGDHALAPGTKLSDAANVSARNSAVKDRISSMNVDELSSIKVEMNNDPAKGPVGVRFKEESVRQVLNSDPTLTGGVDSTLVASNRRSKAMEDALNRVRTTSS